MDENGKTLYGFLQDEDGTIVYDAVQKAVDDARSEGADAIKEAAHADIGLMNGGGLRSGLPKRTLTYENIIGVYPLNNSICVIEATGQQIVDALEWTSRGVPEENGSFLQVSGITHYEAFTLVFICSSFLYGVKS